jgi:hypothetical protein
LGGAFYESAIEVSGFRFKAVVVALSLSLIKVLTCHFIVGLGVELENRHWQAVGKPKVAIGCAQSAHAIEHSIVALLVEIGVRESRLKQKRASEIFAHSATSVSGLRIRNVEPDLDTAADCRLQQLLEIIACSQRQRALSCDFSILPTLEDVVRGCFFAIYLPSRYRCIRFATCVSHHSVSHLSRRDLAGYEQRQLRAAIGRRLATFLLGDGDRVLGGFFAGGAIVHDASVSIAIKQT